MNLPKNAQNIIDGLSAHASVRNFTPSPLEEGALEQILYAGQCAASSSFLQAYSLIRISDKALRQKLMVLCGNQSQVGSAAEFVVYCADLHRLSVMTKTKLKMTTELLLTATIDVAIMAQNSVVAAEALGLGTCYIGGLRNQPDEVVHCLDLPAHTYGVFGLCIGHKAKEPSIKPRLPLDMILHENTYNPNFNQDALDAYDNSIVDYYKSRNASIEALPWTVQMQKILSKEKRPHLHNFLKTQKLLQSGDQD